jgi:uncharacterized membrane protein|tara:strand:+ start:2443 stop:2811 length:369 start_codon:yes stop_codon:yes gene_type:complete
MSDLARVSIILLFIDIIYLTFLGGGPFMNMVSKIQNSEAKLNKVSAAFTYVMMIILMHQFVINKNFTNQKVFLLGFLTYGIFDFTNMAIFSNYDIFIAIQDTIWGGILFMITNIIFNRIKYN